MTIETNRVPQLELNNGVRIPQFGLGVFQIPPDETAAAVREALEAGYRHLDTAQMYRNEEGVGAGIRDSGVPREEIFVTTKLANDAQGHDNAINALEGSLQRLELDYVDLYLIHWPLPKQDRYVATWHGFEELQRAGKARAIGVSNFQIPHLERLAAESATVPAVNQIELHPGLQQAELRAFHAEHGIATEAWSPLAQGAVLTDPAIVEIAARTGKSAAQVVLRWHLQLGNIVIPKSVTPARIRQNLDVFDFDLTDSDLAAIATADRGLRTGPDPDQFN